MENKTMDDGTPIPDVILVNGKDQVDYFEVDELPVQERKVKEKEDKEEIVKGKEVKEEKKEGMVLRIDDYDGLLKEVVEEKLKLAVLKRKKRLILEEIHRQCLEGEIEPRKKIKTVQLSAGTISAMKASAAEAKIKEDEAKAEMLSKDETLDKKEISKGASILSKDKHCTKVNRHY